jgi:hypothetical protein
MPGFEIIKHNFYSCFMGLCLGDSLQLLNLDSAGLAFSVLVGGQLYAANFRKNSFGYVKIMIFTFRDFIESNVVIDYFLDSHY